MLTTLIPIWTAYTLAAISPGPAAIYVLETTALGGRKLGRFAGFGVSLGSFVWVTVAAIGLGELVHQVPQAGFAMKFASAALLSYFLIRTVISLFRRGPVVAQPDQPFPSSDRYSSTPSFATPASAFYKGFLANLLNPSALIFFMSLFAPMISETQDSSQLLTCVLGVTSISLIWYQLLVTIASHPAVRSVLLQSERAFRAGFGVLYLYFLLRLLNHT